MSAKIKCDSCKYIWGIENIKLKERSLIINDSKLILTYFECPRCKKIFKVVLKDRNYFYLVDKLNKIKEEIQLNFNSKDKVKADILKNELLKVENLIKENNDRLNKKYPGKFKIDRYGVHYEQYNDC